MWPQCCSEQQDCGEVGRTSEPGENSSTVIAAPELMFAYKLCQLPAAQTNNSKAQTTKQQLFHPSLGFGYSRFLEQPPYSSGTQEVLWFCFSVSLQTTIPFSDHYVCLKVKSERQAGFSQVPYKCL